ALGFCLAKFICNPFLFKDWVRFPGTAGRSNFASGFFGGCAGLIRRHYRLIAQLNAMLAAVKIVLHDPRCYATGANPQTKSRHFIVPFEMVRLAGGGCFDLCNIAFNEFHFIPPFPSLPKGRLKRLPMPN